MNIKVLFIRHGDSCSNLATHLRLRGHVLDATLSPEGRRLSVENGRLVSKQQGPPDMVFSSTMRRAVETAWLLTSQKVWIAPYLKEQQRGWGDTLVSPEAQEAYYQQQGIQYAWTPGTRDRLRTSGGHLRRFLHWLGWFLTTQKPTKRSWTIWVVTHGLTLNRFLIRQHKTLHQTIYNNQALGGVCRWDPETGRIHIGRFEWIYIPDAAHRPRRDKSYLCQNPAGQAACPEVYQAVCR